MRKLILSIVVLWCMCLSISAQRFFNLTPEDVRIDSVLPCFTHQILLGKNYVDSVYEISISYPEFIEMSTSDIARYHKLTDKQLPEIPQVNQQITVDRKHGIMDISFCPLVMHDGHYSKLVSFMLNIKSSPIASVRAAHLPLYASSSNRYADHSVLSQGKWVKICVSETGIYQLTDAFIRKAGFSDLNKVKVYGYGGALQPEVLSASYLTATDDLKEIPTLSAGGRKLFHAVGPVNWTSATTKLRERNNYADYGYYFLTEGENPLSVDEATFRSSTHPHPNDYHSMVEPEEYAWYHSGRNLFSKTAITIGNTTNYTLNAPCSTGTLSVAMTYDGYCEATVSVNGTTVGRIVVSAATVNQGVSHFDSETTYSSTAEYTWDFTVSNLNIGDNTVSITQTSGTNTNMRLDHATLTFSDPRPLDLSTNAEPTLVGTVANQDRHADAAADMIIIIPASRKLQAQAERLKTLHEEKDHIRVRIVAADELYNEFSSGTPDASAYRRYMKMLYDRAESDADMPRYLLLFGDCAWDNRMHISDFSKTSPDDYLLCYESENSFSKVYSYVCDDFFGTLDDEERIDNFTGKADVAVGRISANTVEQAQTAVDKIYSYRNNEQAGAWQNLLCFLGDDGDNNQHMVSADEMAKTVASYTSAYNIKKVYWDAYTRSTSSTGNSYPDVRRIIKQQMNEGALLINYSGHGGPNAFSHEQVLVRSDFAETTSLRLPLWVTASCDIMPFDGYSDNIGETAMFNKNGGAIAFFGTTRTVFMNRNTVINRAFMKRVLGYDNNGQRLSIGEAMRLAKNELVETGSDRTVNKMNYALLGDPALVLAAPTLTATIDSINGKAVTDGTQQLNAGSHATISGHIEGQDAFNGVATFIIRDIEETITCKMNASSEAFTYKDRPNTIYSGSDSVRNGRFTFSFAIPKDISYSSDNGQMLIYAVNNTKTLEAHGEQDNFNMSGTADNSNDGIGPSVYCYLNKRSFTNGSVVNNTPYFYAELTDNDGLNAAGNGIGHDMELIIDGDMTKTYILNNSFRYNFGDYRSGTLGYSIPTLEAGEHKLLFRAWDILNNSSSTELSFIVDPQQEPELLKVICTRNPATTNTRFLITHDRTGSQMDVALEIYDPSGRILWRKSETGVPTDETYTVDWDLTTSSGSRLRTGVYLYRILISSNGSSEASKAQKLIIINKS